MTPGSTTILHFVRHGQVHNPQDVFYGLLPGFGLSVEGLRQARALAPFFDGKPIHAVVSSPLLRARQTAAVLAQALGGLRVAVSSALEESRTPYDGASAEALRERGYDIFSGNQPPYEQPADVFQRAFKFMRRVCKNHPGSQVIAVTHADIVVFLSLWAQGHAVNYANKRRIELGQLPLRFPAPASVTSLAWEPGAERPAFSYYQPE